MTSEDQSMYTEMQLDALQEIGNIGASHASSALSKLLGTDVMIDVTESVVCRTEKVPEAFGDRELKVIAIYLDAISEERGHMLIVMPIGMGMQFSDIILGRPAVDGRELDEDDMAALSEIGNICASAYLSSISDFLGNMLLPSTPSITVDMQGAVLELPAALAAETSNYAVLIRTNLKFNGVVYPGYILYLPDRSSQALLMKKFEDLGI